MKCNFFKLLFSLALLSFASCVNDETTSTEDLNETEGTDGLVEFAVEETNKNTASKTMGLYTGSGIDFYWTSGDKLWVNNADVTPSLIISTRDNIQSQLDATGNNKAATAKFYFYGTFTKESYPVRYTGNGNNDADRITIKETQYQQSPNDGSHIGSDGDCGVAIATKSEGKYKFMLSHKASYITFTPYYCKGFCSDVKVTQIKVTADKAIAGNFNFNDNGIELSSRPSATTQNSSITLVLNGGGTNGFEIPTKAEFETNGAIMVIAPGTYSKFTVEYTLYDNITKVGGTFTKEYSNLTFTEGKNKRISSDLDIINRGDKLYMWDAEQDYWYGYEDEQPVINDVTSEHYPKSKEKDPNRWYNDVIGSTVNPTTATRGGQICPNVNEIAWYVFRGNPHWDSDKLWSFAKHLYKGGMWFKKKSIIIAENQISEDIMKSKAHDGKDYRVFYNGQSIINKNIVDTKPSNIDNYFFLPAINYFYNGKFDGEAHNGGYGDYWTSSATPYGGSERAINLGFKKEEAAVRVSSHRSKGSMRIAFE